MAGPIAYAPTIQAIGGAKSYPLSALTPKEVDFWLHDGSTFGSSEGSYTAVQVYQSVPWIYRAVQMRAQAMSDIPWIILRGKAEIATSEESIYPDDLPWLSHFKMLIGRVEMSLCMWGAAYWHQEKNRLVTLHYRSMLPPTIIPKYDKDAGVVGFTRKLGGVDIPLTTDEVVYWWLPSVTSELGPGDSPVMVALRAASVLLNVDEWAKGFFARGAAPLTLLTVDGNPPQAELDRLERWWKRLMSGVRKAFDTVAIRASIHPQVIGSPPKDLAMTELSTHKREDISVALGVPINLLFSSARRASSTAAVSADDYNFYTKTVLPEAEFIEEVLNSQIFKPLGLEFRFQEDKVDIIQAHQQEKAFALIAAFQVQLMTREEWRQEMGLPEVPIGEFAQPAPVATPPNAQSAAGDVAHNTISGAAAGAAGPTTPGTSVVPSNQRSADLERWQVKALKAFKAGRSPNVPFESDEIDPFHAAHIRSLLASCLSSEAIRAAFRAKAPMLPGADGSDADRQTLERRHARAITAALKRQLDAALPPGTNETNIHGAEQRARDAGQPLRDTLYAMLVDGVLLGTDVGRRQTEAMMGVGPKAMVTDATGVTMASGADWSLVNVDARRWASKYAYDLVGGIDDTTAKVLQSAISEYVANTLSLDELKAQIADAFGAARAERIAVTEITRAYAEGTIAGLKAGGMIDLLIWHTVNDERVCTQCGPLNGTTAPLDGGFSSTPPLHVSCRCFIGGAIEDMNAKSLVSAPVLPPPVLVVKKVIERDDEGRITSIVERHETEKVGG